LGAGSIFLGDLLDFRFRYQPGLVVTNKVNKIVVPASQWKELSSLLVKSIVVIEQTLLNVGTIKRPIRHSSFLRPVREGASIKPTILGGE
jgi:hypothetical protein